MLKNMLINIPKNRRDDDVTEKRGTHECRDVPSGTYDLAAMIRALYIPMLAGGRSDRASLHFALACPYISPVYKVNAAMRLRPLRERKSRAPQALCKSVMIRALYMPPRPKGRFGISLHFGGYLFLAGGIVLKFGGVFEEVLVKHLGDVKVVAGGFAVAALAG